MRRTVTVGNALGLHARAASKLVSLVGTFDAEVTVAKGDMRVPGDSILGLMMLSANPGTALEVEAAGPQAEAVLAAIAGLFARNFDESAERT